MNKNKLPSIAAPKQNLARLVVIRWLLLLCLALGSAAAHYGFDLSLPFGILSLICLAIAILNLATWLRLKKPWPVTSPEFFLQILLDIIGVSLLFYFSGGASNPFVFYYLVPLSISSATLPWRYTWALAALSVACYTLLLFYHLPIAGISPVEQDPADDPANIFNAHVLGMWFNFIISAGLITFFVVRMSNALKQQQAELNRQREESLRDEQVLGVATLAAGTAHELGSPLTTMKVLIDEMVHEQGEEQGGGGRTAEDLALLKQQVELCSNTLRDVASRAEATGTEPIQTEAAGDYCRRIIQRWQLLRPDAPRQVSVQENERDALLRFHSSVEQAIINLLNNAADAARQWVHVAMHWDGRHFVVNIRDDGGGVPDSIKDRLGKPFVSTKGRGLGLGIFLSNASITRYGGYLELADIKDERGDVSGTHLHIRLPRTQPAI